MLCLACLHSIQTATAFTSDLNYSTSHQLTYQGLQISINDGCYICNRFWDALSGEERDFISGVQRNNATSPAYSSAKAITEISLNDAKAYGHSECYLLQVAYHKPPNIPSGLCRFWRASFLLEPITG